MLVEGSRLELERKLELVVHKAPELVVHMVPELVVHMVREPVQQQVQAQQQREEHKVQEQVPVHMELVPVLGHSRQEVQVHKLVALGSKPVLARSKLAQAFCSIAYLRGGPSNAETNLALHKGHSK